MSQKMSQKDAVFNAVVSVMTEKGIKFEDGQNFGELLSKENRSLVTNILVEGFKKETIELDKSYTEDSKLRTYVSGLVSNWLRKDKRMNGGMSYIAKNPGSRAGSGDSQLKALRTLLKQVNTDKEKEEIQSFITKRVNELKLSKSTKVEINFDILPTELRSKYSPEN